MADQSVAPETDALLSDYEEALRDKVWDSLRYSTTTNQITLPPTHISLRDKLMPDELARLDVYEREQAATRSPDIMPMDTAPDAADRLNNSAEH